MYFGSLQYRPSPSKNNRESGWMMIVLVFLMVGMAVALMYTAPALKTAVQRDKEEEMVHRGAQYARAVKKYFKKFGRYPPTIEALEDTNHIRFLRKRYKDPFTQDGKWDVVRFGQVQMNATGRTGGTGFTAGQPGMVNIPGVTGLVTGGAQNPSSQTGLGGSIFGNSGSTSSTDNKSTSGTTGATGTTGTTGTSGASNSSSSSEDTGSKSTFGQPIGGNPGQQFGGGAIIGVSSKSNRESLRIVADKNHYKDWKFIYDPTLDRGGLINGPYDPKKQLGNAIGSQGIGTPIGQQGTQPNTGFGNTGGFGNSGGFGKPINPGGNMPPDLQASPTSK